MICFYLHISNFLPKETEYFFLRRTEGYPRTPVHSISFSKRNRTKRKFYFPPSPFYIERGSNSGLRTLQTLIPFSIAGRRDDIVLLHALAHNAQPYKKYGEPRRGASLRANLNEAWKSSRMRDLQLPSPYRGRVQIGVDVSFSSFLRAKEKDKLGCGGIPRSSTEENWGAGNPRFSIEKNQPLSWEEKKKSEVTRTILSLRSGTP